MKTCNYRNKEQCPVDNKCCTQYIIYKATLTHNNTKAEYTGSTELAYKTRYNLHAHSFSQESKRAATTLSKSQYVWRNNINTGPVVKWKSWKKMPIIRTRKKWLRHLSLGEGIHHSKPRQPWLPQQAYRHRKKAPTQKEIQAGTVSRKIAYTCSRGNTVILLHCQSWNSDRVTSWRAQTYN